MSLPYVPSSTSILRGQFQIDAVVSTPTSIVKWRWWVIDTVATVKSMRLLGPYLDSIRPIGLSPSSRAAQAADQLECSMSSAWRR